MTKPALAATRALTVLNYFSANPQQPFTLTELSLTTGVSPSSLSSVLRALTDAGYLVQHRRHKTYEIGPALIPAGQAASSQHPVVELARPEMQRLAHDLEMECVGSLVVGQEMLIVGLEGRPAPNSHELWLGQRQPLIAPLGQVFIAWANSGAPHAKRWMESVPVAARQTAIETLELIRERGYSVHPDTPELNALVEIIHDLALHPDNDVYQERARKHLSDWDGLGHWLRNVEPEQTYRIRLFVAPVFGPDGSVVFALTLTGPREISGMHISEVGEQLAASGALLTRKIGGRMPRN